MRAYIVDKGQAAPPVEAGETLVVDVSGPSVCVGWVAGSGGYKSGSSSSLTPPKGT